MIIRACMYTYHIMQIVHCGKLSQLQLLAEIHRKTFTVLIRAMPY